MQVSASTADLLKQQSGDRACDLFCQVLQVISNVRWSLKTTALEYRSANDFHEGPDSKYFRLWEPGGLSCGLPWWRRQERICLPMQVLSLGLESPLEKGVATHSSILAWEIPWTVKPGRLQSLGLQRVRHNWVTNTFTGHCCNYSTLCNPMDYIGHGILQARILEWVTFPSPGDLSNPGTEPRSPALQVDSLSAEPPVKHHGCSHRRYMDEWMQFCSNKMLLMGTNIWISFNFIYYKILLVSWFFFSLLIT